MFCFKCLTYTELLEMHEKINRWVDMIIPSVIRCGIRGTENDEVKYAELESRYLYERTALYNNSEKSFNASSTDTLEPLTLDFIKNCKYVSWYNHHYIMIYMFICVVLQAAIFDLKNNFSIAIIYLENNKVSLDVQELKRLMHYDVCNESILVVSSDKPANFTSNYRIGSISRQELYKKVDDITLEAVSIFNIARTVYDDDDDDDKTVTSKSLEIAAADTALPLAAATNRQVTSPNRPTANKIKKNEKLKNKK